MNQGIRLTIFHDRHHVKKLLIAVLASIDLSCPPNWHVTIHLERAKVEHGRCHKFLSRFLKQYGDCFRAATGGKPIFLYAFEFRTNGLHVHILLYAPDRDGRRLATRCRKWLKASGGRNDKRVLKVDKIKGSNVPGSVFHLSQVGNLVRYLLKGADPVICHELGLDHQYQGRVIGKRAGCSQCLGGTKYSNIQLVELFALFESRCGHSRSDLSPEEEASMRAFGR
jgi:hypothetical protein